MILLPAVDIRGGKAVRLRRGRFDDQTVYADDPLAAARLVRRRRRPVPARGRPRRRPRRRAGEPAPPRTHSGRARGAGAVRRWPARPPRCRRLAAGAERVVLGTAAYTDTDLLDEALAIWDPRVLVAVDVRDGRVSVAGWTKETQARGEEVIERLQRRGATRFVYTNVDRDGMLADPTSTRSGARGGGGPRPLSLLGRHRVARGPARAALPAAAQPRRRDLRQGPLRASLQRARGAGRRSPRARPRRGRPCC